VPDGWYLFAGSGSRDEGGGGARTSVEHLSLS
jgi:hypothetical protein